MLYRTLKKLVVVVCMSGALSAYAVTNNTNPLKLIPGGMAITGPTLVKNAKVNVIGSDFWENNIVIFQLTTTDATSNEPAWNSSNWSTVSWPNNECSANAPHNSTIDFAMNTASVSTDDKLQKLMSMVQIAQLTGMQMTIVGTSVTGSAASDCVVTNIQDVFLRNTTY